MLEAFDRLVLSCTWHLVSISTSKYAARVETLIDAAQHTACKPNTATQVQPMDEASRAASEGLPLAIISYHTRKA